MEPKPLPRPVKVHGHQFCDEGLLLALDATAFVVEWSTGRVSRFEFQCGGGGGKEFEFLDR